MRRTNFDGRNQRKRDPQIAAGGKHLQTCSNSSVGINESLKRRSVQRAARDVRRVGLWRRWELLFRIDILTGLCGVEDPTVEDRAHFRLGPSLTQDAQLLLRPCIVAGETKQLEEKCPVLGVGRIATQFLAQSPDGFVQLSRLEQ